MLLFLVFAAEDISFAVPLEEIDIDLLHCKKILVDGRTALVEMNQARWITLIFDVLLLLRFPF